MTPQERTEEAYGKLDALFVAVAILLKYSDHKPEVLQALLAAHHSVSDALLATTATDRTLAAFQRSLEGAISAVQSGDSP